MGALALPAPSFIQAISPLEIELEAILHSTLQPVEQVYLKVQTAPSESLVVTNYRLVILKGSARSNTGHGYARYFPIDSLFGIEVRRGFFGGGIALTTAATVSEPRESDLSRCSFAVSFRSKSLLGSVEQYLEIVHDAVLGLRRQQVSQGPIPQIAVSSIISKPGESFYYSANALFLQHRLHRDYVGGTQGISFRIFPGVYYRIGGYRSHPIDRVSVDPIDSGTLAVSNLRILFIGTKASVEQPLSRVTAVHRLPDGVEILSGNSNPLIFRTQDPLTADYVDRLCTNPP